MEPSLTVMILKGKEAKKFLAIGTLNSLTSLDL